MSGNKNSGRRTVGQTDLRRRAIQKAWELTSQQLDGTDPKRYDTAVTIASKDMTIKTMNETNLTITQEEQSILDRYVQRTKGIEQ